MIADVGVLRALFNSLSFSPCLSVSVVKLP